jgi:shikimate kinase / 3-dehydroquinate synthase
VEPAVADKHVALVGFMGAGKTSIGREVARLLDRPFIDLDEDIERRVGSIPEFFERFGEGAFRHVEATSIEPILAGNRRSVVALGGGAVTTPEVRAALRSHALTVSVDVDVEEAWHRVGDSDRPLARDRDAFRALFEERASLYRQVADATARDADDVVLAAAAVHVEAGALERLGDLVPGEEAVALVADSHVAGIHGAAAQLALGARLQSTHELPRGEQAKTLTACERLWRELALNRDGTLVALGGGSTTDAAGFVAATFLRGVPWVAVPTTLAGQVDAAIGGKTGVNLEHGKNLVGAFHWPVRAVADPSLLQTLPETEMSAGLAEAVKTGLLAGERLWELPLTELVRRCAAFKAAVCLRDPLDRGARTTLNLGHTFAHALEAASGYTVPHGRAVALGLTAALRLSGLSTEHVDEVLRPEPVHVDRDDAWTALKRDKKGPGVYVLLEAPGRPVVTTLPDEDARRALDELIAR